MHSWQNPGKRWTDDYDEWDIGPNESFIMLGYGSPVSQFINKSKPAGEMSSEELKTEIMSRVKTDRSIHPNFVLLAEQCVLNSAWVHVVKDCQAVKAWGSSSVTLIGDSVFK